MLQLVLLSKALFIVFQSLDSERQPNFFSFRCLTIVLYRSALTRQEKQEQKRDLILSSSPYKDKVVKPVACQN